MSNFNKISLFLILTLLFVLWPYYEIIRTGTIAGPIVAVLMWAPGLAAIVTQLLTARTIRGLGWRLGQPRYLLVSFLLPMLTALVVYGLFWGVGLVPFTGAELVNTVEEVTGRRLSLAVAIISTVVVLFLPSLSTALGEEIGWRGLLLPELANRYGFTLASLISGVIWAVYHVPAILFADYHSDAPLWFALVMFTISVVSISFVTAWLRLKSGSLWTAAILHASHNLFVQSIFDPLTLDFGLTPYLTTEFGAGLAVAYALIALYTWRRRDALGQLPVVDGSIPPGK
jgi:membrane protease YdiL (CAAX protease family)